MINSKQTNLQFPQKKFKKENKQIKKISEEAVPERRREKEIRSPSFVCRPITASVNQKTKKSHKILGSLRGPIERSHESTNL